MNLVLSSQFRPFTYDEMVKPLMQYKEAYDKVEQDYSDLVTQTEAWKDIATQENSPEAYAMYKGYSDQLNSLADTFSKEGLKLGTRRSLLGMKRRYASDITPIAKASEAMNAANELRVKAGPDAIFEVSDYNSLDDFLHGKTANNKYQSREALTKKTAAMTEAAMAEAIKDPEFKKYMGDQFWLITQHSGGSYEDLKAAIANNPQAQNRFAEIKQRVMQDAGIDRYDTAGQQAIEDAVNTGLYAGLDKPVRSFQANADHMTPAQKASIDLQRSQLALSAASSGMTKDSKGNWVYDPTKDPGVSRAGAKKGGTTGSGGSGSSSTERSNRIEKPIKVRATNNGGGSGNYAVGATWEVDKVPDGAAMKSYGSLTPEQKTVVDNAIGTDTRDGYNYYVVTEDASGVGTGDDDLVVIVPKKTVINGQEEIDTNAH